MRPNRKSVIRSFRVEESALEALEAEAKGRNVSANTLLNQLLKGYADFDRFFEKLGMMKVAHATFGHLLQSASEEEVIEAGRRAGQDVPRAIISAKEGTFSPSSALEFLRIMGDHANLYRYNEVEADRKKVLTMMHELGPKGSLFIIHYASAVLETVGIRPKLSSTDHSVTLEFSL